MEKAHKKPFVRHLELLSQLDLIHLGAYGPMNVNTCHGASKFLNFDDYSQYGNVYLLSQSSRLLGRFKCFDVKVDLNRKKTKNLVIDCGRQYKTISSSIYMEERHLTIPGIP